MCVCIYTSNEAKFESQQSPTKTTPKTKILNPSTLTPLTLNPKSPKNPKTPKNPKNPKDPKNPQP